VSQEPVELATDDYSVEMWVKPSHVHNGGLLSMLAEAAGDAKDARDLHAVFLQLLGQQGPTFDREHPCRIRFLHRNPPGTNALTGTSCISKSAYTLRRWQHVVGVKEGESVRLYVDGVLSARANDKTPLASGPLRIAIGQPLIVRRVLPFVGQLDEIAIYDHALSDEEVARHHRSVHWKSNPAGARGQKDF
jgi:hypothetical protein